MEKRVIREPLTNDLVFKVVFGRDTPESKQALIALLNLILDRREDPIVDITYKSPFSFTEEIDCKTIIMDVLVETQKGELIDIEMQMEADRSFINRSVFYGCRMLTNELDRGEYYDKMKKTIVISFLKGKLFPDADPFHSTYRLYEKNSHHLLTDMLELHYIELGKIDWKHKSPQELTELERFCAYLTCTGKPGCESYVEELTRSEGREKRGVISMTDQVLKKLSRDELLRQYREDRERFLIDQALQRGAAREEGRQEGHAAGLKEGHAAGRRQQQLESARKLKNNGISLEIIIDATGLSKSEIEAL